MVASKRSSPCVEALRSKYKVTDKWLWDDPRKCTSQTWKAVEKMKKLVKKGACFFIGDGLSFLTTFLSLSPSQSLLPQ